MPALNSVALVLKKFRQTTVDAFGHTDSTGSDQHNFDRSQCRALAVANCLSGHKTAPCVGPFLCCEPS